MGSLLTLGDVLSRTIILIERPRRSFYITFETESPMATGSTSQRGGEIGWLNIRLTTEARP